jgi:8-oxo-dGTP diphosphatase
VKVQVVAAIIERGDRRLLIGQRRRGDSSPLKWEFPGGKVRQGETLEQALARELREELDAELMSAVAVSRVEHDYGAGPGSFSIVFFAAEIGEGELRPGAFERVAWVLPRELGNYDFLAANRRLVAELATGRIKPAEVLVEARERDAPERH